jgi:vacuolar-type H+-ATPase subunit E/Vma4
MVNEILRSLELCSVDELEMILAEAKQRYEAKKASRKQELWNNIVNAIQEYENEIEDITIDCDECGADVWIGTLCHTGTIGTTRS